MIRIEKRILQDRNWKAIYEAMGKDTATVAKFIKQSQRKKKIRSNDLDSILLELANHTDNYIAINASGITFK